MKETLLFPARWRRGVIFSLMAVLLATFFILLFWTSTAPRLDVQSEAVALRVAVMNEYVQSWDSYVETTTALTTRAALLELTRRVKGDETPVTTEEVKSAVSDCLRAGTTDFEGLEGLCYGSVEDNLSSYLNKFATIAARELNIQTEYAFDGDFAIVDRSPLTLQVSFWMNYTVTDGGGLLFAAWNRSRYYSVLVSTEGLPDPLAARYAPGVLHEGLEERSLNPSTVVVGVMNRSDVERLLLKQEFFFNPGNAPTYLERLAGMTSDFGVDSFKAGVESLVNPVDTLVPMAEWGNTSFTDHQLYNRNTYPCGQAFGTYSLADLNESYDGFHLNLGRLEGYGFELGTGDLVADCSS